MMWSVTGKPVAPSTQGYPIFNVEPQFWELLVIPGYDMMSIQYRGLTGLARFVILSPTQLANPAVPFFDLFGPFVVHLPDVFLGFLGLVYPFRFLFCDFFHFKFI